MFDLRRAAPPDFEFLVKVDLEDEGVTTSYQDDWTEESFEEHRRLIAAFLRDPDKVALIVDATEATRIALIMWRYRNLGTESLPADHLFSQISSSLPVNKEFCEIYQLWVHPNHRRRGIATKLKQAAEADARSRGVTMIYTHTEERNAHVIELNTKLGYREVRRGPIWDEVIRVSLVKDLI